MRLSSVGQQPLRLETLAEGIGAAFGRRPPCEPMWIGNHNRNRLRKKTNLGPVAPLFSTTDPAFQHVVVGVVEPVVSTDVDCAYCAWCVH